MRPSWDEYYLGIAVAVSQRADCTRRKVGAIIVKDARIVGQGYNGAPPGRPGCLTDSACPRGRHFPNQVYKVNLHTQVSQQVTVCGWDGKPWPCPESVAPLSSYDTGAGMCIAVHAEANALLRATWSDMQGATLYLSGNDHPCGGCTRLIEGSPIIRIVWQTGSELL